MRTMTRWLAVFAMAALTAAAPATAQDNEKTTGEGIKVHGHWTIDVRNADGSPAAHHEFENALVEGGSWGLSHLLSHEGLSLLGWDIIVWRATPAGDDLRIVEPVIAQTLSWVAFSSTNLTLTTTPEPSNQLVLQGSSQVTAATTFASVDSFVFTQDASGAQHALQFSHRNLPQPIAVDAGQIVQVTVTFSFS